MRPYRLRIMGRMTALEQSHAAGGSGIVDQNVDLAELVEHGLDHVFDLVGFADIGGDRQPIAAQFADFVQRVIGAAAAHIVCDDGGPARRSHRL